MQRDSEHHRCSKMSCWHWHLTIFVFLPAAKNKSREVDSRSPQCALLLSQTLYQVVISAYCPWDGGVADHLFGLHTALIFHCKLTDFRRFPDMKLSRKRAKQTSGLHLLPSLEWAVHHHPGQYIKRVWWSHPIILHSSCQTSKTSYAKVWDLPLLEGASGSLLKQKVGIKWSIRPNA